MTVENFTGGFFYVTGGGFHYLKNWGGKLPIPSRLMPNCPISATVLQFFSIFSKLDRKTPHFVDFNKLAIVQKLQSTDSLSIKLFGVFFVVQNRCGQSVGLDFSFLEGQKIKGNFLNFSYVVNSIEYMQKKN